MMRELADDDNDLTLPVREGPNRPRLAAITDLDSANLPWFLKRAEDHFSRAWICGEAATLGVIRLEGFQRIVARLGKDGAARLMRSIAARCLLNLRVDDVFEYLGRGRFGILFSDTKIADADRACERVCNLLAGFSAIQGEGDLKLTASYGLTGYYPADSDVRSAVCRALKALRQARGNDNLVVVKASASAGR